MPFSPVSLAAMAAVCATLPNQDVILLITGQLKIQPPLKAGEKRNEGGGEGGLVAPQENEHFREASN